MKTHLRILSSKNGRVRSAIVRHLLLAAMLSGMLMMLCCAASANDEPVLSLWAKEEAFAAEEAGILPDALHGDLRGAGNRGQAVWYLVKLTETVLQKELPNTAEGVFPDMENTFFEEKAEKAYSAGIVTGYADGSFGAGNHIRREEYAAMLYRLFQYLERETGKQLLPDDLQTRPYADEKEISAWALDAVHALSVMGILGGDSRGDFCPDKNVSLEQMIVPSYRCWKYCTDKS